MACYKKGGTIDISKDEKGVEVAEEVNLNGTTKSEEIIYKTMHDEQDSENDDDDKVLINADITYRDTLRKKRKGCRGLVVGSLLVILAAGIVTLSYVAYALHDDLESIKNMVRIQESESAMNKRNYESLIRDITGQIGNLTIKLHGVSSKVIEHKNKTNTVLSKLEVKLSKNVKDESTSLLNKIGNINSTLSKIHNRASTYYPIYDAKFMGFGYPTNRTNYQEYHSYTLERCLGKLYQKRKGDHAWNGLAYGHSQKDGWCICYKNSGRLNMHSNHYLYYIFSD